VRALIDLQKITGMRPGEAVRMRRRDIDTAGAVWVYRPQLHKTAHHGHAREVRIGPKAQAVLAEFLRPDLDAYLFSPAEAEAERLAALHARRKRDGTPLSCGNTPGSNRKHAPMVKPGAHYAVRSYRQAVARACRAAGVPPWHPHQLRHNAATEFRRLYGLETARVLLGHRSAGVTTIYAEADQARAAAAMGEVG
jgi:integrase